MIGKRTYRIVLGIFCLLLAYPVFSQDVSGLEGRRKKTEENIAYINSLLSKTGGKKTSSLEELGLLQKKIDYRREQVRNVEAQIGLFNQEISSAQRKITTLQKELKTLKEAYASLLSAIYTKRRNSTWLMYVLASDDLSQAYRRLKYFRSFADLAVSQGEQVKTTALELEEKKKELEEKKKELVAVQKEREAELKELVNDESKLKVALQKLEKEEKSLKSSLQKEQASLKSLNAEIKRILSANTSTKGSSNNTGSSSKSTELPAADKALSGRFEANRGKLPWPLKRGVIIMKHGAVTHPLFKLAKFPPNDGITISTDANAEVYAIFDGEVKAVFPAQSYRNCVAVRHGEYLSIYCKLRTVKVKTGDKVKTGESLGVLDVENGASLLYFQLWKQTKGKDVSQNPELWFVSK